MNSSFPRGRRTSGRRVAPFTALRPEATGSSRFRRAAGSTITKIAGAIKQLVKVRVRVVSTMDRTAFSTGLRNINRLSSLPEPLMDRQQTSELHARKKLG